MLCRNLKHIVCPKISENRHFIPSRQFSRRWVDTLFTTEANTINMSSRLKLFRNLVLARLFGAWTRSCFVNSVVKRCKRDGRIREVIQCFRQALMRPRRTLMLTVSAAYKNNEEKPGPPGSCSANISDQELTELLIDLEGVDELCRATLYCPGCERRVAIDNRQPGVRYCQCDKTKSPEQSYDGWEPFLEAEDIIIWRKEYKPGPLYAYKVYGRYKHLNADDFAAIQVDGAYRKVWDTGVAALSLVERNANGQKEQDVVHWEVLWPRLFANRDYVYLRRHKEFSLKSRAYKHKDRLFDPEPPRRDVAVEIHDRPNVHSNAKRKALEDDAKEEQLLKQESTSDNKAFVIVSRSCTHREAPPGRSAIRVTEYWSHMVIKTINGPNKPGMEFVLTYYDEPAVGGLPTAVTSWAMGRAGPAFLASMRAAAADYRGWRQRNPPKPEDDKKPPVPGKVSLDLDTTQILVPVSELEMETSQQGPALDEDSDRRDQATQTDGDPRTVVLLEIQVKEVPRVTVSNAATNLSEPPSTTSAVLETVQLQLNTESPKTVPTGQVNEVKAEPQDTPADECEQEQTSWWRYLYPFYYFS